MKESDLVTIVGALVDGRMYPDKADFGTPTPYITWQQVGGKAVNYLEAQSSDKKNARIQITVWDATRKSAMTLIRQIEDLAVAAPLFGVVEGAAIAAHDGGTDLRGANQDFSFWISP